MNRDDDSQLVPVISFLKDHVYKKEKVSPEDYNHLLSSFDELISFDDELTVLILDNIGIHVALNKLKIVIKNFSDQMHINEITHSGSFTLATRAVIVCTSQNPTHYTSTLIHELTHAVSGFAFRFDPFPCMEYYNYPMPRHVKEFIEDPVLPYPMRNSSIFYPMRYYLMNQSITLNPAKLKFNYCAREDIKKFNLENATAITSTVGSSANLDSLLWDLHNFHLENPEKIENHEEIFPIYMELRIELLRLAKEKSLPKETTYDALSTILPRIHDYSETDIKKLLKYRLDNLPWVFANLRPRLRFSHSEFHKQVDEHSSDSEDSGSLFTYYKPSFRF